LRGDTLTVRNVFKDENKIKVIDFWASWCSPCISEIKKGNIIRKMMTKNNDVEWIYFSIDLDKEKWINKSKELDEFGLSKNQYLILNPKNSELIRFFGVNTIPRYIILNKKGDVIAEKAPRPTDSLRFKKIINYINLKKKEI